MENNIRSLLNANHKHTKAFYILSSFLILNQHAATFNGLRTGKTSKPVWTSFKVTSEHAEIRKILKYKIVFAFTLY